jgi:hypothetical protein
MPQSAEDKGQGVEALIAQFTALRNEIEYRTQAQSNLVQLNITAIGAVGGFGLSQYADERVLLLVPVISTMLGLFWLDHAAVIVGIGDFIRDRILPKLALQAGLRDMPNWEEFVQERERRLPVRLGFFGLPFPFVFAVVPFLGLLFSLRTGEKDWFFVLFLLVDFGLLGVLVYYWLPFATGAGRKAKPGAGVS